MSKLWVLSVLLTLAGCIATTDNPKPNKASDDDAALYNTQLGVQYMRQGKLERAMEKFQRALEQDPNRADTNQAIAVLYERIGEVDKADEHYRRALRLEKDSPEILNAYGAFLCNQGRRKEGQVYFERAALTPLYSTPAAAFTNAGVCARADSRPEEAEQYFRRALAVDPRFVEALLQMASLTYEQGYYLQTRAFVERFLQTTSATPDVLWMGFLSEREMGNREAAARYANQLKNEFPESVQTRRLLEMESNAG